MELMSVTAITWRKRLDVLAKTLCAQARGLDCETMQRLMADKQPLTFVAINWPRVGGGEVLFDLLCRDHDLTRNQVAVRQIEALKRACVKRQPSASRNKFAQAVIPSLREFFWAVEAAEMKYQFRFGVCTLAEQYLDFSSRRFGFNDNFMCVQGRQAFTGEYEYNLRTQASEFVTYLRERVQIGARDLASLNSWSSRHWRLMDCEWPEFAARFFATFFGCLEHSYSQVVILDVQNIFATCRQIAKLMKRQCSHIPVISLPHPAIPTPKSDSINIFC